MGPGLAVWFGETEEQERDWVVATSEAQQAMLKMVCFHFYDLYTDLQEN